MNCVSREFDNGDQVSGPSLYYDGFGCYDFQKNVYSMKTLKEIEKINEKIALLDNSLTEETCTEASLHYCKYGSPG